MSDLKRCPIPGCQEWKTRSQLLCKHHWLQVPAEIRHAVLNEYRLAPGSPAHLAAIREAISSIISPGSVSV